MDLTPRPSTVSTKKLNVAMFPWLAFGHMIPFLELAKRIAQKGHHVSFISTPRNIDRLPNIPSNLAPLINFVKLTLPHNENLPENAEATIDVPFEKVPFLKKAYDGLQHQLVHFLENKTPDWIFYDFAPCWLPSIAAELGISRAFFNILNAWSVCLFGLSSSAMINGDDPRTKPEHFTATPPWIPFPTEVAFRLYEAKKFLGAFETNVTGVSDMYRLGSAIAGCEVYATRSCRELQPQWLDLAASLHQKLVLPLGLLPPSPQVSEDEEENTEWVTISTWLDKNKKETVVYVALGSEVTLSHQDLTALALGLELSNLPFFWALRKPQDSFEPSSVKLPDGFEDRTKDHGVVWTSWAPQLRILAHESVGGFLTHCGWSSIIEGLQYGRPLIMLPFLLDQGLNARAFEDMKLGLEIPRNEEDGLFTLKSVVESLRSVMEDDIGGKIYKENAREMKKIFKDKDLHNRYIDDFVNYLQNHRSGIFL